MSYAKNGVLSLLFIMSEKSARVKNTRGVISITKIFISAGNGT